MKFSSMPFCFIYLWNHFFLITNQVDDILVYYLLIGKERLESDGFEFGLHMSKLQKS